MLNIEIGNSVVIEWKISRNGKAEDFTRKALKLYIVDKYQKMPVDNYEIKGNILRFAFLAKEQSRTGIYGLELIENDGADDMTTIRLCHAFRVGHCCNTSTDVIELSSEITLPADGLSAYELAVLNGFVGTEQEWLESLGKPAKDAASEALAAAGRADSATETAMATNTAVQQAEQLRVASEQERVSAESQRTKAEQVRTTAESGRDKAEQARATAESQRTKAEQQRSTAESVRQTSESERQSSETSRRQAEIVRKKAEDTRVASEQSRVAAEFARVKVEKTRVAAESVRETAEHQRQTDTATAIKNAEKATAAANDTAGKANAAANRAEKGATNLGIEDYPEFSAEKSYIVGEVVRYSGKLYRFTVAHPAGAWVGTDAETTSVKEELDRAVALKANVDGYYETMRVGTADNLTARGEASEEIIMNRTAGGNNVIESGDALIKSIKGNSLTITQVVNIEALPSDEYFTIEQYKDNGVKCNPSGQPSEPGSLNWSSGWLKLSSNLLKDHIYYYSLKYTRIAKRTDVGEFTPKEVYLSAFGDKYEVEIGIPKVLCNIKTINSNKCNLTLNDCTVTVENIQLVNLTQMFGAGNEPATPEEFARRLGYDSIEQVPYIPYNEGEIVSCNAEGIRTTDAEGDTYERKWASTLQKYFPDGLKSAGTIYDEITPTKAVKRICSVKMNSLGWVTHNDEFRIFRADIANMAEPANYEDRKNGLLSNAYKQSKTVGIGLEMEDPSMLRGSGVIYIKDSRYSDLESFINHFTENDELYYELATPEEYEYDELNLTERVAQGGKEEAIVSEGVLSTPLKIDVVYPIDTYGTIVNNKKNIGNISQLQTSAKTDLVVAINELKTQLTQLSAATEPALMSLRNDVDGLISDLGGAEDMRELPAIAGQPLILFGHGAPAKGKVPDNWNKLDPKTGKGYEWNGTPSALGQQYLDVDASPGGLYIAARDTNMGLKWINC